jgi:ABC-2 type transport system permease protein
VSAALAISFAALGVFAIPLLAITPSGFSSSPPPQNSAAAIVGTLVYELAQEAVGGLVHASWAKHYLLSDQFDAWHGLFQTPA